MPAFDCFDFSNIFDVSPRFPMNNIRDQLHTIS